MFSLAFRLLRRDFSAGELRLLALALVFWGVHQPLRVGVGLSFAFGLAMDIHQTTLLGQHALAYTALGYMAASIHRRLLWCTFPFV